MINFVFVITFFAQKIMGGSHGLYKNKKRVKTPRVQESGILTIEEGGRRSYTRENGHNRKKL